MVGKRGKGGVERVSGGRGQEGRAWGSACYPYPRPGPLKHQSGLRFEGPQVALSNRWRGVFVCMCGGSLIQDLPIG